PNNYENGGMREMSFYHKIGISGKLAYQHNQALLLTIALDYHWAKKDIPVATRFVPGDSPRYWRFPNWERYSSTISSEWKINSRLSLKSVLFADAYNDRLIEYKTPEMKDDQVEWNSLLKNFTTGGLIHGHYRPWQQHQLLAGIQFRQDRMKKKADTNKPWEDHYALTGSLFLQDDFTPWKNTTLTLGVGYHFHQTDISNTNGNIAPMISFQQQLTGNWKLFSSYSHTVRFPTLHKLYSQTSGNPELKPETADKIELGVNKIFFFKNRDQYFSADLALFYNKMNDLIYRATRSLRYKNISQATMQGVEIRTNWSLNRYLAGEFSYSFIDFPRSALEINDYLPTNKLRFMLTGKTGFGTTLNYEGAYIDKRQFYYSSNYIITLPDYFVNNLNLIQTITSHITARLELSNFLDKYYEEEFGFPQPGRQIMAGIRLSF
ncbi:MAG TPA: TonB-dependent receptor, partial [bacterium]|nr:TonB-dependent receptor [bacterium]